jgi:hypothetical protein
MLCTKCNKRPVIYPDTRLCEPCHKEYLQWLGPVLIKPSDVLKGTFVTQEEKRGSNPPYFRTIYSDLEPKLEAEFEKELKKIEDADE